MVNRILEIYKEENWFRCYESDAKIISYLMGYKVIINKDNRKMMVGFPNIEKVQNRLEQFHISYELKYSKYVNSFDDNRYDEMFRKAENENPKKNETVKIKNVTVPDYKNFKSQIVREGCIVFIKSIYSNTIEKYKIRKSESHIEPRWSNSGLKSSAPRIREIKISDTKINGTEITTSSPVYKIIKGCKVGFEYIYNGEQYEIMDIR